MPCYFFVTGTSCQHIEIGISLLYQKYCPEEVPKLSQMKTMLSQARIQQMSKVTMLWDSVVWTRCLGEIFSSGLLGSFFLAGSFTFFLRSFHLVTGFSSNFFLPSTFSDVSSSRLVRDSPARDCKYSLLYSLDYLSLKPLHATCSGLGRQTKSCG